MKVYLLLVYDDYYPAGDNVKAVYSSEDKIPDMHTLRELWHGWQNIEIVEKELQ